MKIKYFIIYLFFVVFTISACSTAAVKNTTDMKTAGAENINRLRVLIENYNSNSPQSYMLKFDVEGHSGSQKFKTSGNARYNKSPKRMKIVFHDAILQSSISEIILEDDILKIYFPLEKTLYLENIDKINFQDYINFNLDFNLIYDLLTGRIPLIKQFSVYKGLESQTETAEKDNKLLILENEENYETISFLDNVPDRILWVNKKTKDKIELYLNKPVLKDNSLFYKEAKIVSRGNDLNITIKFNSVKYNVPVDVENITKVKVPKDVKIIKRD